MASSLCDALNLAGTSLYNLNIRFRRRLLKLNGMDRSETPTAYQLFSAHVIIQS
jgi:hypothetical protein